MNEERNLIFKKLHGWCDLLASGDLSFQIFGFFNLSLKRIYENTNFKGWFVNLSHGDQKLWLIISL